MWPRCRMSKQPLVNTTRRQPRPLGLPAARPAGADRATNLSPQREILHQLVDGAGRRAIAGDHDAGRGRGDLRGCLPCPRPATSARVSALTKVSPGAGGMRVGVGLGIGAVRQAAALEHQRALAVERDRRDLRAGQLQNVLAIGRDLLGAAQAPSSLAGPSRA